MIDIGLLQAWIDKKKKKQEDQADAANTVKLPNGIQIHIHMPKPQELPLTPDGKSLATRNDVARYPA